MAENDGVAGLILYLAGDRGRAITGYTNITDNAWNINAIVLVDSI